MHDAYWEWMMNDFTKEELECLHNAIALQLRDIPMSEINAIRRSELVEKLQSMIDNYNDQCEIGNHEWSEIEIECERYGCNGKPVKHCFRCGQI